MGSLLEIRRELFNENPFELEWFPYLVAVLRFKVTIDIYYVFIKIEILNLIK
ncbi:hypothetical protein 162286302 [Organic Lake phycodnavirus]|jgi:hypothetical protein|nr:hypothetical protein 162286302 [Organic Lake phycodnavirus]